MGSSTRKQVEVLVVELPWAIKLPRRKAPIRINMNEYRNLHYRTNNSAKKKLTADLRPQLEGVSLRTPVVVSCQVMKPSRRKLDKGNIYAVGQKYLYDAMTEYKVWPDDNDEYIKHEVILPTILDKDKKGKIVFTFRSIKEEVEV